MYLLRLMLAVGWLTVQAVIAGEAAVPPLAPAPPADRPATGNLSFTFTLPEAAATSAGVYADGKLVRTLWSNVRYPAGAHPGSWDGLTDEDAVAPTGAYTIKVLANNVRYQWEGVIGNTSASFTGRHLFHSYQSAQGMAIAAGHIYLANGYNEAGIATIKTEVAAPVAKTNIPPAYPVYGFTDATVAHVATDGVLVYWAGSDPFVTPGTDDFRSRTSFVYASKVSDDSLVEFAQGTPWKISRGVSYSHSTLDFTGDDVNGAIGGLAVQSAGPYLFVTHPGLNTLRVFNKTTGAAVSSLALTAPGAVAVAGADQVWVCSRRDGRPVVQKYTVSPAGQLALIAGLALTDLQEPLALAVSPDTTTLLVADGGASQQVKAFDNATAASRWTYGQEGGYAQGPAVAADKFFFSRRDTTSRHSDASPGWTYLAYQPDGSFWVGDPGNYRSQHYAADRTFLATIMWLPGFYALSVDPNNPSRVFADWLEFQVDYTKPLAPDNGSWTLVRNWGGTRLPEPYTHKGWYFPFRQVVTLPNGRTYALFRNFVSGKWGVAELDPQQGLRFTASDAATTADWLAADGAFMRVSRPLAQTPQTWSKLPLTGFTATHDPTWGEAQPIMASPPLDKAVFDHAADTSSGLAEPIGITTGGVLVSFSPQIGITPNAAFSHNGWHLAGFEAKSGELKWRAAPSTPLSYRGAWPDDGAFHTGNTLLVGRSVPIYLGAGDRAYALGRNIFYHYYGEGTRIQSNYWTQYTEDGLMVGYFGTSAQDMHILPDGGYDEGRPGQAGNAASTAAVQLGEAIYLFTNDESYHGGVHRARVDHLASLREQTIAVTWDASRYAPPAPDPTDLLAGLPRAATGTRATTTDATPVPDGAAGWTRVPAADVKTNRYTDWWTVATGVTAYKKSQSPDLDMAFAQHSATGGKATVTRALGLGAAPVASWSLAAVLSFSEPNAHGGAEGMVVELLDDTGKVLVRLEPQKDRDGACRLAVNGQAIFQAADWRTFIYVVGESQPLTIQATDGQLTFTYAAYPPVSTPVFDATANWQKPQTLRVSAWATPHQGLRHTINLKQLHFTVP